MTFKNQTKDKIKTSIIIIGAILACIAPFFHIVFPRVPEQIAVIQEMIDSTEGENTILIEKLKFAKENAKVMGFNTARKFWYAIGKPITMLYFAFIIMLSLRSISDKFMKKAMTISSLTLMAISVYFIIWGLWAAKDFPKPYYYTIICVISILSTWMSFSLTQHYNRVRLMARRLLDYIIIQIDDKYIPNEKKEDYYKDYMEQIKEL